MKQKNTPGIWILALAAAILVSFLAGCSSISPWQKGLLADPAMKFASEENSSTYEQHMLNAREASSGGYGGVGGGCGCK